MTTAARRLDRLLPGLTLPERLDALLGAYFEDRHHDPELLRSVPEHDLDRWYGFTSLLSATHTQLGWYIEYLEATVTQVELRHGCLAGFQLAAVLIEQHLLALMLDPEGEEKRAAMRARRERLDGYVAQLSTRVADEVAARWREVRIAELGADELAAICFGRDLLHPSARETLVKCRERLLDVKAGLAPLLEVDLEEPEPEPEHVAGLVRLLQKEARR